jgi:MFS family permease
LLVVRVFLIPRFSGGALSISVAFFSLFGFIFLITQYFQFVKGYSTLSAGVHTLPFAIVAAVFTPVAAVVALKVGTRLVVTAGLLLMAGGLLVAAFNSLPDTAYYGPIILAMVLLALGLSSITAPTAEAVMGSVPDEQRGAAAGVNNTTRELGGTLGVAVFGSLFASSYGPKIIAAFAPLPIPAVPKAESHQSMAAALEVVDHAPHSVRATLENVAFSAFHSGLEVACIVGAGVAVVGALAAFRLLPGRTVASVAGAEVAAGASAGADASAEVAAGVGAGVAAGACARGGGGAAADGCPDTLALAGT